MFPGINKDYGILKGQIFDGENFFDITSTEPAPIELGIWEPVEPLYPSTLSFEFDIDEIKIKDLINDSIATISATGVKLVDNLGNVFESAIIQVLEKPKHRVKKGKKYIWKYKNSDHLWMQGSYIGKENK